MKTYILLITFVLWLFSTKVIGQESKYFQVLGEGARVSNEFSTHCHDVNFDDSHWPKLNLVQISEYQYYCIRIPVNINQNRVPRFTVLRAVFLGSAKFFWDGKFIANKGEPGLDLNVERVGPIEMSVPLSQSELSKGFHLLSIELSTYHHLENMNIIFYGLFLSANTTKDSINFQKKIIPLMLAGAMFFLAVFFALVYFLYEKKSAFIVFGCLCLFSGTLICLELIKYFWNYPWDFHIVRLRIIIFNVVLTGLALITYYLYYYQIKRKLFWLTSALFCFITLALFAPSYDMKSLSIFVLALVISLLINVQAYRKNQSSSLIHLSILIAGFILIIILPFSFIDKWFAALFSFIALANLYSLMIQFGQERLKAMQSLRLEAQMLRKNLQPHFLMNSLTLIVEWVETEPKLAVKFIDALADEFRLLNNMSQQKFVLWSDEMSLCQKHFEIMKCRYQKQIQLTFDIKEGYFFIPPAIIHTIIENAFSHNRIKNGDCFHIKINIKEGVYFKITTPFRNKNHQGSGIGEDYIKTRLMESFDNNWSFESTAKNDTWQTDIQFPLITNLNGVE
ncbi:hypothetical protein CJF42_18880 [Pseudoalteromonas sp. NBT06-2]|uniref:sensor histidine kinase n=1 Tax=Pseudoalteromonas sp. NBT06-2 TaxID=2025950 RepID=UPI000BA71470|nr:histidine kinase [Pseudoalteromonas sp. NBT06-2]PAJ72863.1 hypothetical protein CJF42_18880 [Pseudoalteromonas sp. NBT06-2]